MSEVGVRSIRIVDAAPPNNGFVPGSFVRMGHSTSVNGIHNGRETSGEQGPGVDRYAEGFEAGRSAAAETYAIERASLLKLIEKAGCLQPEASEELAVLIAETVFRLVTDIVGTVNVDRECLARRASAAASLVAECDNARTLCVNPEDLTLLDDLDTNLTIVGDPSLARGDIRIDCSAGWIEHGTSLYLDALRLELGQTEARQ